VSTSDTPQGSDGAKGVVDRNLRIIFSITLIAILGVASITPAIPSVGEDLQVPPTRIGLLITAFTLPGVVLTPVAGMLADRWGRKRVLVPSLLLFALGGSLCAVSADFEVLVALRALQGIGAASLGALNVTLIGDLYDGSRRAAAMGYNASVLSVGTAVYPAIGGALALVGWRYAFALPLLAIPVAIAVMRSLDTLDPSEPQALGSYLRGAVESMRSPFVGGLLLASVCTFVILYGSYLTYLPVLMKARFDSSSMVIGVVMSCASLTTALVSSQLGRLSLRFPQRRLIQAGFVLYAVSLAIVPSVQHVAWLAVPAVLYGFAQGINIPTIMDALASRAPMRYRAGFMSVNGMVLRTGQTLGPAIMGGAYAIGGHAGPFYAGSLLAAASLGLLLYALRSGGELTAADPRQN
jgi:MFS family permease